MTDVLHIAASPKGALSASRRIAEVFLEELRRAEPQARVRELVLFETALPEFGAEAAIAKFAPLFGETRTPAQAAAWAEVLAVIADFDRADKIVISTPMWNYGLPYRLKHYIDILMQPRVTFGYDPQTMLHMGLLRNRPVQLVLTRSSVMPGDYADFQTPHLKYVLNAMGLQDVRTLAAWRTTRPTAEAREAYVASFFDEARAAARVFGGV